MKVWVLGSGSRGNATVIDNGDTRVLVDAGFSARELKRRMEIAGIAPESIEALILTHEHNDHMCGAVRAARRWKWAVHASSGTVNGAPELENVNVRRFTGGETLTFSSMNVHTVPISHDANDPIAVVATDIATGARAAVVLDLGRETSLLRKGLKDVEVLVIESNHDEDLLANGPYPFSVQRRISSHVGHLSNREAAAVARSCAHADLQHVVLAHISESCNTREHALGMASASLERTKFRGKITAATQDHICGAFVGSRRGGRALQLGLGL